MDVESFRKYIEGKKIEFGVNTARYTSLNGSAEIIFAAKNAKKEHVVEIENNCRRASIKFEILDIDSEQLGAVCGKPFNVSFVTVMRVKK